MSTPKKKLLPAVVRKALALLPDDMNPLLAIDALSPNVKRGARALLSIAQDVHQLGPADPPADLFLIFLEVGARYELPAELLAAIAAVMSGYDRNADGLVPGRSGLMGLPRQMVDTTPDLVDQVRAAAFGISARARASGLVPALIVFTGSAELATEVVSWFLFLTMRSHTDADTRAGLVMAGTLLEE